MKTFEPEKVKVEIVKTKSRYYPFDTKIFLYINNNWCHVGNGRFCRTIAEAKEFKKEVESRS